MRYEHAIEIDAPPEIVWDVMIDVERWSQWTASISNIERLDADLRPGSRVRIRQPRLPQLTWEVTELTPGRSFAWAAGSPGARSVASHVIEHAGPSRSRVTLAIDSTGPLARLIAPLTSGITRRYLAMEAEGLREEVESAVRASRERPNGGRGR